MSKDPINIDVIRRTSPIEIEVRGGGGGSGTRNYNLLINHPMIENNELIGNKTYAELGLVDVTPQEIDDLFDDLIYGG